MHSTTVTAPTAGPVAVNTLVGSISGTFVASIKALSPVE
jgi:hypothetical protein